MQTPNSSTLTFPGRNAMLGGELQIISLKDVKKAAAKWLLQGWLPQGACCMLEGRKGVGKSHIAAAFAAWISGGPVPPQGKKIRGGVVVWGAGEESIERETKPKLLAAGARMDKVKTFGGKDRSKINRLPKFPGDFAWLAEQIDKYKVKLLVLDPIRSFVEPWVNLKDEQHGGMIMEGLSAIGNRYGCCCLGLRNLKKGRAADPLDEGIGGVALGNVSRVVLRARPPEKDEQWSTLRVLACNYGLFRADHQFRVVETPKGTRLEWGKALVQRTEDELLGELDPGQQLEANVAEALILKLLENGPLSSEQIYKIGLRESINKTAMWRTMKKLGCIDKRHGFGAATYTEWSLPGKGKGKKKQRNETKKKK